MFQFIKKRKKNTTLAGKDKKVFKSRPTFFSSIAIGVEATVHCFFSYSMVFKTIHVVLHMFYKLGYTCSERIYLAYVKGILKCNLPANDRNAKKIK